MTGRVRVAATLLVLVAAGGYIAWRIDLRRTSEIIRDADVRWVALAAALILAMVFPMSWRWQLLLRARGIGEGLPWLIRAYLVSYTFAQVLPAAVGGDASRIYETARRHPGQTSAVAGSVLVERAIGGLVTLTIAALGFLLAIGRYSVGPYLWLEAVLVLAACVFVVVFFSRRFQVLLVRVLPIARKLRVERLARGLYRGIHGYRTAERTLALVFGTTVVVQALAIASIYCVAQAVDLGVAPLAYVVFGPLLFLVTLVPFTINGLGVREAFFVSFLGNLGASPEAAFVCGILFFVLTIVPAFFGLAIMSWEALRRALVQRAQGDQAG